MTKLQRVDQLTVPIEVGKFYLVPTVLYTWFGRRKNWPIIGPKHDDAEFLNFKWQHYHVDPRFLSNADWQWLEGGFYGGGAAAVNAVASPLNYRSKGQGAERDPFPVVIYRRRHALRAGSYPRDGLHTLIGHKFTPEFLAMWGAFAGQTAAHGKHGWICPHKKMSLGSVEPDANGVITCPLHGLRICSRTGLVEPASEGVGP